MKQYIALLTLMFAHEAYASKKSQTMTHKTTKQQESSAIQALVSSVAMLEEEAALDKKMIDKCVAKASKVQKQLEAMGGLTEVQKQLKAMGLTDLPFSQTAAMLEEQATQDKRIIDQFVANASIIKKEMAATGFTKLAISEVRQDNELLLNEKARHKIMTFHQWSHEPSLSDEI